MEAAVKVKGFSKLSEAQRDMFLQIHKNHMMAMGTDNQKKYALENVKKVVWDKKENCLKVYYEDTWWHYGTRGTWYYCNVRISNVTRMLSLMDISAVLNAK